MVDSELIANFGGLVLVAEYACFQRPFSRGTAWVQSTGTAHSGMPSSSSPSRRYVPSKGSAFKTPSGRGGAVPEPSKRAAFRVRIESTGHL